MRRTRARWPVCPPFLTCCLRPRLRRPASTSARRGSWARRCCRCRSPSSPPWRRRRRRCRSLCRSPWRRPRCRRPRRGPARMEWDSSMIKLATNQTFSLHDVLKLLSGLNKYHCRCMLYLVAFVSVVSVCSLLLHALGLWRSAAVAVVAYSWGRSLQDTRKNVVLLLFLWG